MLIYIIQTLALEHVVVYDKNQCPVKSKEKFRTCNERMLYDRRLQFGETDEHREFFFVILENILNRIKYRKSEHKQGTTATEI